MKRALAFITYKPKIQFLDFINILTNSYTIYLIIDDEKTNWSTVLKSKYPNIIFIQIISKECYKFGYKNLNFIGIKKIVSGWDKAIFYFCKINKEVNSYEFIWFIEDDVFLYDVNTLLNIDNKYSGIDLLSQKCEEAINYNDWLWRDIFMTFSKPWYNSMCCSIRVTNKMLQAIKDYVKNIRSMHFLEAFFPTIAVKYNLSIANPSEMETIIYRYEWQQEELNKTNLFHPIKDINKQIIYRNNIN